MVSADYILRYRPDYPIAVVEAKSEYQSAQDGVQQARDYAEVLGLRFAYASNGREIIEIDLAAGTEVDRSDFPTPDELWQRQRDSLDLPNAATETKLLTPGYPDAERPLRYYQEIAVNRTLEAVLGGQRRALLNLCTGAGKTAVAFQLCWRLWSAGWNKRDDHRKPKILFLADRNILIDDPKDKTFAPFGDARWKIGAGRAVHSRDIYFSTYQAIAEDERREGLYREYARDFFDLIVIDECHRGSARQDSSWREILEWFEPAYQIGMTATPLREESRDTYAYLVPRFIPIRWRRASLTASLPPTASTGSSPTWTPPAGDPPWASSTAMVAQCPTRSIRPATSSAWSPFAPAPKPSPGI